MSAFIFSTLTDYSIDYCSHLRVKRHFAKTWKRCCSIACASKYSTASSNLYACLTKSLLLTLCLLYGKD